MVSRQVFLEISKHYAAVGNENCGRFSSSLHSFSALIKTYPEVKEIFIIFSESSQLHCTESMKKKPKKRDTLLTTKKKPKKQS